MIETLVCNCLLQLYIMLMSAFIICNNIWNSDGMLGVCRLHLQVIVEDCKWKASIDEEGVCLARVVEVVNYGSKDGCNRLQVIKYTLKYKHNIHERLTQMFFLILFWE